MSTRLVLAFLRALLKVLPWTPGQRLLATNESARQSNSLSYNKSSYAANFAGVVSQLTER